MNKLILVLCLTTGLATAQNALWIDLSGEWRMLEGEDNPEFADPAYDDSKWSSYKLPAGSNRPPAQMWLRRTAVLPDGTDKTKLALTLGTINEAYEVYVNGVRVGGTGGFTSWDYKIPRPLTFPIPGSAIPDTVAR